MTALTGRVGQVATTQQQLLVIVPPGGEIRAELLVPTSAAGFLSPSQEVRLAIDAFSYLRFGTVQARILQVSSVAIPQARPEGGAVPVYIVTARLARPTVRAFGRAQPLMPGMTLTAWKPTSPRRPPRAASTASQRRSAAGSSRSSSALLILPSRLAS